MAVGILLVSTVKSERPTRTYENKEVRNNIFLY